MNKRKNGFTLIELLVVIAVVGVLIALLLPVLAAARKNASKARCVNNLSQIKRLLDTYTAENSMKIPFPVANWKRFLDVEKQGTSEIFQCPSTDSSPSYSLSVNIYNKDSGDNPVETYLSQIGNTATSIFICDGIKDLVKITDGNIGEEKSELYNAPTDENARIRHLGGANYLTLDGTIKYWVPPKSGDASINTQGLKWKQ